MRLRERSSIGIADRAEVPGRDRSASAAGFTLVEIMAAVATMLVVMTAAWMLLVTSNDNLNRVGNGSQASDDSRVALAAFERDLGHAMLPTELGSSAVLVATPRTISFLSDVDTPADGIPELVTWSADDNVHALVRSVTWANSSVTETSTFSLNSFTGGVVASSTVLTGLATSADMTASQRPGQQPDLFSYAVSATNPGTDLQDHPGLIGLISVRLRNGVPDKDSNVMDRTGAYRVISYVINGY